MEELNEEEMKNVGGACMTTTPLSGYTQIYTGGKPGNYRIMSNSDYRIKTWHITSSKNERGGSPNYKVIDQLWVKPNGEVWCHTPTGKGSCQIYCIWHDKTTGLEVRNTNRIQFL